MNVSRRCVLLTVYRLLNRGLVSLLFVLLNLVNGELAEKIEYSENRIYIENDFIENVKHVFI